MKQIALALALVFLSCIAFAQSSQASADKIVGVYWSPKKDAKIEIFNRGGKYFGKFIWSAIKRTDSKHPNQALRNRDLLGVEFLTNFRYDDGSYTDGEIYDPESGKTYDCKITIVGQDLRVRGYIGLSIFGRTETFQRVK